MKKILFFRFFLIALIFFIISGILISANIESTKNYVLIFQGTEFTAKISDSIDFFFNELLKPEDNLLLLTSQKHYHYSQKTRQTHPLKKLIQLTKNVIKRDFQIDASSFDMFLDQMMSILTMLNDARRANEKRGYLNQYRQLMNNIRNSRKINESFLLELSQNLKKSPGQSCILIFLQKEMRYIPDREKMNYLRGIFDIRFEVNELFAGDTIEKYMDVKKITQVFNEIKAKVHLIYIPIKTKRRTGVEMRENSNDLYNAISKISKNTGGTVINTAKPLAALKKICGMK